MSHFLLFSQKEQPEALLSFGENASPFKQPRVTQDDYMQVSQ
jgi:hypothetical protein